MARTPPIHENFKQIAPPPWVRVTVERLLASLGPEHAAGITSVVLTDAGSMGKGKANRIGKRKYHTRECLGFYHHASRTEGAWIEIVVDNVTPGSMPKALLWFQAVRDYRVAKTL